MYRALTLLALTVLTPKSGYGAESGLVFQQESVATWIDVAEADIDLVFSGADLKVVYDLSFDVGEGVFEGAALQFVLPKNAHLVSLSRWKDDGFMPVERASIALANDSLRVDLENFFRAKERFRLIIAITGRGRGGALHWKVPIGLGQVGTFSLATKGVIGRNWKVRFNEFEEFLPTVDPSRKGRFKNGSYLKRNFIPPEFLTLRVVPGKKGEAGMTIADHAKFSFAGFLGLKSEERIKPKVSYVFWDFSLSEQEHHRKRLEILERYIEDRSPEVVKLYGVIDQIKPLGILGSPGKGVDDEDLKEVLHALAYDGVARLDLLAAHLQSLVADARDNEIEFVLFTDGTDPFQFNLDQNSIGPLPPTFIISSNVDEGSVFTEAFVEKGAAFIDQRWPPKELRFDSEAWQIIGIENEVGTTGLRLVSGSVHYPGNDIRFEGELLTGFDHYGVSIKLKNGSRTLTKSVRLDPEEVSSEELGLLAGVTKAEGGDAVEMESDLIAPELPIEHVNHTVTQEGNPFARMLVQSESLSTDLIYQKYLQERARYHNLPLFYIEFARVFANRKNFLLANRVLSNILEVADQPKEWLQPFLWILSEWNDESASMAYASFAPMAQQSPWENLKSSAPLSVRAFWAEKGRSVSVRVIEPGEEELSLEKNVSRISGGVLQGRKMSGFEGVVYENIKPRKGEYRVEVNLNDESAATEGGEVFVRIVVDTIGSRGVSRLVKHVLLEGYRDSQVGAEFSFMAPSARPVQRSFPEAIELAKKQILADRLDEAEKTLEEIKGEHVNEDAALVLFHLARIRLRQGRYEQSIRLNEESLVLKPSLYEARYNIACTYALAGEPEKAIFQIQLLSKGVRLHKPELGEKYFQLIGRDPDLKILREQEDYGLIRESFSYAH